MSRDQRARGLTRFTIAFLVVYVPIETLASLPALWDPFYLVDFIGMVLLAWGLVCCWRRRTSAGIALLTAGYAWEGANFWRALFGRVQTMAAGGTLRSGSAELWFVAIGTVLAVGALIWSLRLATTTAQVES
jgi:hypothetical protein